MATEVERRNCPYCGNLVPLFTNLDGVLCWGQHRYGDPSGESCDKSQEPVTAEDDRHEADLIQGYADAHPDDDE